MTMEQDTSPSGISSNGHNHTPHPKRTRILLSCAPCRNSKLKCDRDQPCGQCQKKGRADLCVYAPKPDRHKPARGMAARLKRLEGMVRGMMDVDGNVVGGSDGGAGGVPARETAGVSEEPVVTGQVVRHDGETATTYVGATHVLAMLEDVSCAPWLSIKIARACADVPTRSKISSHTLRNPRRPTMLPHRSKTWKDRTSLYTVEELQGIEKIS